MARSHVTEDGFVEVVHAQGDKGLLLEATMPSQDLLHSGGQVVVDDALRHTAPVLEGTAVALKEGFLLLMGKGHHKGHTGVAQSSTEEMGGCGLAIEDDLGSAPVDLGPFAWVKGQRHEDRSVVGFEFADGMTHGGLSTGEAMLVAQETP